MWEAELWDDVSVAFKKKNESRESKEDSQWLSTPQKLMRMKFLR
jgi:hypothetical protein